MNSSAHGGSFFTSLFEIPETTEIYARLFSLPVPFCLTLINLDRLEQALEHEMVEDHLLALLSSEEKKLFSGFAYPKRRKEWLGGRLAAKYAVCQLLAVKKTEQILPTLSILPTESGSPRLTGTGFSRDQLPALSISHSGRFAVALAAAAESCGVDIQKISPQTQRVADRFCEPHELQLLRDCAPLLDEKERLTLLWSAKEALKKALLHDQPVIFQGVALQSVAVNRYFTLHLRFPGDLGQPAEVTALMLEDCVLAYTLVPSCHA